MQVLVDQKLLITLPANPVGLRITQVDKTPPSDEGTAINGRFIVPIVEGVEFQIDENSYVWPVDGQDISSQSFSHLLASFPMFGHIFFNPLLTAADIDATSGGIDFSKTFKDDSSTPPDPPTYFSPRLQTGRETSSLLAAGNYPGHTALLPINNGITPARPGLLVTKEIDLTPYVGAAGTDEFCLYWRLYDFETSEDHAGDYGIVGDNTPAIRTILETDQEPTDFSVYISPDNGVHWCGAGRLEPIAFTTKTTSVRLAFVNRGSQKVYIANYAMMF